jgi:hypothetical protein
MKATQFSKVSEYINAGGMSLGLFLMESPAKETEKALAFSAVKMNACANPYQGLAWLPKSQLEVVENDFYTDRLGEKMYLVPGWLYRKNFYHGESI